MNEESELHPLTDPMIFCLRCERDRNVKLHTRDGNPPESARKWLWDHCELKKCEFFHRAEVVLPVSKKERKKLKKELRKAKRNNDENRQSTKP